VAERAVKRGLRIAWVAACLALGAALLADAWDLARAGRVNRQLAADLAAGAPAAPAAGEDPRVWIAAARAPARSGHTVEAAALLRRAAEASAGDLRQVALYDLGNVYLRAALRLREEGADALALPLVELSKESYRGVLLERPDLWDAKFNLELALRVVPDADPDDTGAPPILTGERSVTTMRALTLGLP
jgi:mxaK protein